MNLKKTILLFALISISMQTFAFDFERNGIAYNIINNSGVKTVSVVGLTGCFFGTKVSIPSSVMYLFSDYTVTSIGDYAFEGCSGLTSVEIPNSVTIIGEDAFDGCSGLTSVTIGNSVTTIRNSAFQACSGLKSVKIPNSVTIIGRSAFSSCSGLTSVTIGNSVTSIGGGAFDGCSSLTSVTWNAKNCTDFGLRSPSSPSYSYIVPPFDGLNISSFTFGDEVEHIPGRLCYNLSSLTSVTIPKSVSSIGG